MFQPLVPRTLIKNLDDSLQAQCAKSNFSTIYGNNKPPKIIQKHPTLRFLWGKFGGFVLLLHPIPLRFFFWEKNGQIKGETSPPGTFHPCWDPQTKPTVFVENGSSRISTRSGVATPRRDPPNHQKSFWWDKKKTSSRKYDQRWVM